MEGNSLDEQQHVYCIMYHEITILSPSTGTRLSGGHSLHETSSVLVETVTKTSKVGGAYSSSSSSSTSSTKLTSDASKVVCRGTGLSKALVGQKNNFTVDCSKAGEMIDIRAKNTDRPFYSYSENINQTLMVCTNTTGKSNFDFLATCGKRDKLLTKH